jgi:hypothetical protein
MALTNHSTDPDRWMEERVPPDMQALANTLRALIRETVPEVDEAVYLGWGVLGYRIYIGKRRVYLGFVHPTRDYVSIGFEWGVFLPDPEGLLEGDDLKQVRFMTFRSIDAIPREALAKFIAGAVEVSKLPQSVKRQRMMEHTELRRLEDDAILE